MRLAIVMWLVAIGAVGLSLGAYVVEADQIAFRASACAALIAAVVSLVEFQEWARRR